LFTSPHHPRLKQVRALRQRKERVASGLFVVEGIQPVGAAVEASAALEYLCYAPDLLISPFALQLVENQRARGLPCFAVSAETFTGLAEKENPTGLLAVVRAPTLTLNSLTPAQFNWGVALVAPQDPGNVGAILRSVDAVGASGVLVVEGGVDPYHPSVVRASMGALFWRPIVSATFAEFVAWAQQHPYHVYGTSARGAVDYRAVTYQRPAILLMGSEQKGLTPEQSAMCDCLIKLPMRGHVSSLNLAVATGVMLYAMEAGIG